MQRLHRHAQAWRIGLVAAVLLVGVLGWFGPRVVLGPRTAVVAVARRDFVQSVVASGHVQAPHRVSIGTQIVGTVRRVPVAEGQSVAAGQVLVELEGSEWQAAAAQAQQAVQQAQARLRQLDEVQAPLADAALRQALVTLENAQAQWRRTADLARQGFVGDAAVDESRKALATAQAQLRAARAQFLTTQPGGSDEALANATLQQARAAADVAQARLRLATLRAPVAGRLIARDVEPGDLVQPGKALMVLSPAGTTELVVQVDEKHLGLLAPGQAAQASADAYPQQRFAATVGYINPGVDLQRGSVEVRLAVPQPPPTLVQDMTVSVDIAVAARPRALLLPADAVRDADTAHPWVLKVVDGRARRQAVVLGLRGGGLAEVLQGLQEGDRVVPVAVAGITDGMRLRAEAASAPA